MHGYTWILLFSVLLVTVMLVFSGCKSPKALLEKEIRQLVENPASAAASEFMLYACGWPSAEVYKIKELNVSLDYGSDRQSGTAKAELMLVSDTLTLKSDLTFIYTRNYSGGHGYSYSTGYTFSHFRRINSIPEFVLRNPSRQLNPESDSVHSCLNDSSVKLYDGTPADFYRLNLTDPDPGILITFQEDNKSELTVTGVLYKDNKLAEPVSWYGQRLLPGNYTLLVVPAKGNGSYRLTVKALDAETKAGLKKPTDK